MGRVFREATRDHNPERGHTGPATAPVAISGPAGQDDWTDSEIKAIVGGYLAMLVTESAGQPYSKAQHNRALQAKMNNSRTEGSIEYKH